MSDTGKDTMQDARMIVFDRNLHTVGFTPSFVELFKGPYKDESFLKNTDISFYAPDFEQLGEMERFRKVAAEGGAFVIDAYQTVISEVNKPFIDKICVYSLNGMVYTLHIDASEEWAGGTIYMADMIKYCEDLQRKLSLASLRERSSEMLRNTLLSNIDNVVLPLLTLLQDSGLDRRQAGIVDSIINNLCSATEPLAALPAEELELTKREKQIETLIRQGRSTKEIAALLMVSPRTVDYHRANINRKKQQLIIP